MTKSDSLIIFCVRGCTGKTTGLESDPKASKIAAIRAGSSVFAARWTVASAYVPRSKPKDFRIVERLRAIARLQSSASYITSPTRSEEHTSELQSRFGISYA